MKKKLVFLLLACLMLCVAVPAAMAEDVPNPATDFVYSTTGEGNIAIRGYKGTDPTVVIPSEINGKSVTAIAINAFSPSNTQSTVTSVVIPNSVTVFEKSAFEGCTSLESVTLPNSITTVPNSTFKGCISLKRITIPDSVTAIGQSAFQGCTSLESVIIPDSVTVMEQSVFNDCTNLAKIEFLGNTPPMDGRFFWCDPATVKVIYVPHEAVEAYQTAVGDKSTNKVRCKKHDAAICPTLVTVSVSSSVGGSTVGGGIYPIDETVTLTATPDTGYTFTCWQVNGQIVSASQTYSFTAVKDVTVTVLFTLSDYVVTVTASNGGRVQGGGSYYHGDIVTLTAVPDEGYSFVGWYVNNQLVSTDTTYSFTATESVSLTALFEKMPVLPQTGDNSNVILWSALACISLFGMMTLVRKRKEA